MVKAATAADAESDGVRGRQSWLSRALPILDHLAKTGSAQSTYAIARAIDAPLSSIYGVVESLVASGMVVRNPNSTLWIGPRLYRYGLAYAKSLDFLSVASEEMNHLSAETGETVQICGRDGNKLAVLAMADGSGPFYVSARVGTQLPLNWTASGLLLLGHLPEADRRAAFEEAAVPSPTNMAELDPLRLSEAAGAAFDAGVAVQSSAAEFMVACVASPVCNVQRECVLTISVVLQSQVLDGKRDEIAASVKAAAARIEERMGWSSS